MKRIYYILVVLCLSYSTCWAQGTTNNKPEFTNLDKIVAIVNREAITQSQLDKEIDMAKKQLEHTNQTIPSAAELKKLALDNLISKTLQLQIATTKRTKVTDEDIEKTIDNIAKANRLSEAQLKDAILQTGITFDQYKAQIKEQLLLQKVQQDEVAKNVSFTPEDVQKFMRENKDSLNQHNAFHVVDILMPASESMASNQIQEVKKQASNLAKELQTSTDIDAVLKQYPYAEKNDLGWRSLGELPSLFQSKIAAMKINNASSPIQAPNGFHILKLLDAKGDNVKPTENEIKNLAFQKKMASAVKDWLQKLRQDSYVKIMN